MRRLALWAALVGVCLSTAMVEAQLDLTDPAVSAPVARAQEATLTVENRPILVLRARVVTRLPADRVDAARRVIDRLIGQGVTGPVTARPVGGAQIIMVGEEAVLAVLPADLEVLAGESLEETAATAASRLGTALREAAELRSPGVIARSVLVSAAATLALSAVFWFLVRLRAAASDRLTRVAERRIGESWRVLQTTFLPRLAAFVVKVLVTVAGGLVLYLWLAFVLRQFPYTRVWGESLRALLIGEFRAGGEAFATALPGLITVGIIVLIARGVMKAVSLIFAAVQRGRMSLPGVYPDTADAARRLVTAAVWLLAGVMAYPHVPGSDSSAFKGLSVFVGVVVSLGSSGVMQHLMSGLMLTFSRAVRVGEFARIGDVIGTVTEIGGLATKVRTAYGEEVTIPNAVVVAQTTTNFSKTPDGRVPFLRTTVTIGYDTPWRQVEGLLLAAARETPGLLAEPKPLVIRDALQDFYVQYTLLVAPEDPCQRMLLLDRLHVRILDVFNHYGVQIMSPHYMLDPQAPKVVPAAHWHESPSAPAEPVLAGVTPLADVPRRS